MGHYKTVYTMTDGQTVVIRTLGRYNTHSAADINNAIRLENTFIELEDMNGEVTFIRPLDIERVEGKNVSDEEPADPFGLPF